MGRYTEIRSFVLVAERGSFAAAARVEGVTPAVMGRRLNALESRLGVQLVHRSTRGLTLTDLGEQFLEQCEQLLRDFDAAESSISADRKAVSGRLVVSAPASFGRQHVAPHIIAFKKRHPGLKLSFNFTDSLIDLVSEGYDMAIRVGEIMNPNYVAIKLYPNRRVICGTPGYFDRYGIPEEPEDLLNHNCLAFNLQGGQQGGWTFMRDGRTFSLRVDGDLDCNDGELLYDWVKQGLGVGWRSTWEIQAELKSGQLMTVLDDYVAPDYDIHAVYPQQRYLPAKVRYFIDYIRRIYNRPGYWEGGG
ncbi:MAG TPA: LysR family transcriptional regulator [Burkholderiaceae bacterium]|nr:LysR family transcriptional regulator [Burkholderiaceae bacterium]